MDIIFYSGIFWYVLSGHSDLGGHAQKHFNKIILAPWRNDDEIKNNLCCYFSCNAFTNMPWGYNLLIEFLDIALFCCCRHSTGYSMYFHSKEFIQLEGKIFFSYKIWLFPRISQACVTTASGQVENVNKFYVKNVLTFPQGELFGVLLVLRFSTSS